jgi:hypothetical protein
MNIKQILNNKVFFGILKEGTDVENTFFVKRFKDPDDNEIEWKVYIDKKEDDITIKLIKRK